MEYRKFGNKYVIRFDKGEEVLDKLTTFCKEQGIKLATVSAIGAANEIKLGLFNTGEKNYHATTLKGDYEITSLSGTVSTMNQEVYLHLHITVSDHELHVYGGHLNSLVISATCEMVMDVMDGEVDRAFSDEIGLNLFEFGS